MKLIEQIKFWIYKEFIRKDPYYRYLLKVEEDYKAEQRFSPYAKLSSYLSNGGRHVEGLDSNGSCGLVVRENENERELAIAEWGSIGMDQAFGYNGKMRRVEDLVYKPKDE